MENLERRYRAHPYEITHFSNDDVESNRVNSQVEILAHANRLVGYPWLALQEAFYGEQASALLVVDYDLIAQAPQKYEHRFVNFLGNQNFPMI